jgi:hypothetical protein
MRMHISITARLYAPTIRMIEPEAGSGPTTAVRAFIPTFQSFLQHDDKSPQSLDDVRKAFLGSIKELTQAMDREWPFFSGKEPRLVDFIIAPFATRLHVFGKFKGESGVPGEGKGGEDDEIWKR